MKILKLQPKASLLLKRQDQQFFVDGPISKQFQVLWQKIFNGPKIKEKDNLIEALIEHIPQISKVLTELDTSGSISINIESSQNTFELIFYLIGNDKILFSLEDKSDIKKFKKRIHLHHEALKLIDHAHPGALFQVKRNRDNLLSIDFASPRLPEIIEIEDMTVADFIILIGPETRKELFETFRTCHDDLTFSGEILNPRRYWQIRASVLKQEDDETIFLGVLENITEKVNFESQRRKDDMLLIQSNKMSELGEMASCIAHEINNPLSILSHLLEDLDENHTDEKISTAFQTLERITRIVKILTSFGRDTGQEGPGESPISLERILSDTLPLCQHKLTNRCIDLKVSGDLKYSPFINDTLLSQVFLNLINNSYDEIESLKGKRWINIESKIVASRFNILFSDSGIAPNVESMQYWFDPFHTTKAKGKGTGLGLAICQNLLRAAGGEIQPIAAKNTSFLISLPLWPKIEDKT